MVNFGPQAAEIGLPVRGTPANFNGFRVLAALLHGTISGRQPNFAALNKGRHLHSVGRPSRWALAHIFSFVCWSRRQRSRRTVAADISYRGYQNGTKLGSLIKGALIHVTTQTGELWPKGSPLGRQNSGVENL